VATELSSHDELIAMVEALWRQPVHERRTCAAFLLHARVDLLGPQDLPLLERLMRDSRTWALVDVLAGDALGALLVRRPEAAPQIDRWASDEDLWVRRAALLSQLEPLKAGAPFARFARYADPMLDEPDLYIRKAIGWVLRETSKRRPREVYDWLLPRVGRASGVTLREAVKYLSPDQRDALLAVGPAGRHSSDAGRGRRSA
jgi:3-methyladenine DNA glycosylase AlkD